MLSDEEEILIKKLRYCEQEYEQNGYLSVGKFEAIKQAANLIEKQSKEIEEYKKQLDLDYVKNNYTSNDKIKAKIEELKNNKENYTFYKATSKDIRRTIRTVLQSLLEEKE